MDLRETGWGSMDWIHLAQIETSELSRKTWLHGVSQLIGVFNKLE
jgi:hypothetical protein